MATQKVIHGRSEEVLKQFPDNHFHGVVTDPPYGLKFMGKKWDHSVPSVALWKEVMRVLKPGGYMLVACGTRTQHRMVVNIEDAGFEIRDVITWHYGSGFPKSLDISKQIDKENGAGVFIEEPAGGVGFMNAEGAGGYNVTKNKLTQVNDKSEVAKQWQGWGTALKPATEFWTLCRKPLSESTVAENVLKHGTGGINIDGCRIGLDGEKQPTGSAKRVFVSNGYTEEKVYGNNKETPITGRFPANLILDEFAAELLDEQSGILKSGAIGAVKSKKQNAVYGKFAQANINNFAASEGGASRFFYVAKASQSERNKGLEDFENRPIGQNTGNNHHVAPLGRETQYKNNHPTVKPLKLMEYLVKLIIPEGGICLDLFNGSGTTGCACATQDFNYVGIEAEADFVEISEARIKHYKDIFDAAELQKILFG